jgi:hypothetical protein
MGQHFFERDALLVDSMPAIIDENIDALHVSS